jgi:hypothetical protein
VVEGPAGVEVLRQQDREHQMIAEHHIDSLLAAYSSPDSINRLSVAKPRVRLRLLDTRLGIPGRPRWPSARA